MSQSKREGIVRCIHHATYSALSRLSRPRHEDVGVWAQGAKISRGQEGARVPENCGVGTAVSGERIRASFLLRGAKPKPPLLCSDRVVPQNIMSKAGGVEGI